MSDISDAFLAGRKRAAEAQKTDEEKAGPLRFEIAARPHLAVDLLVANLSGTPCPVKAAAAEGGGQRPAFTGHGVPRQTWPLGSTPKRHTIGQFQTAGFR